jgi:DNA-binding MarR family transcriptional regulator
MGDGFHADPGREPIVSNKDRTGAMNLDNAVLSALRRLIRAADLDARDLARQTGLTTSQLLVLELLAGSGELTVGSIAREVGLAQGTVTSLIDRLVDRGLLCRRRANSDRRQVKVAISDAGRALLAAAPTPLQTRFLEGFSCLAEWEQTAILSSLQRLAHLMGAESIEAAPVLDVGQINHPPDE